MTKSEFAVALYGFKRYRRSRVRDDDLLNLMEAYPDLAPVFEEVQAWRDGAE